MTAQGCIVGIKSFEDQFKSSDYHTCEIGGTLAREISV